MLAFAAGITACGGVARDNSPTLLVGVASSLEPLFLELAPAFEAHAGVQITLIVGSSGALAQQVRQGAPLDALASADPSHAMSLGGGAGQALDDRIKVFAEGRLVTVTSLPVSVTAAWDEVAADERVRHLAIANPELAPYGERARAALRSAGLWAAVEPRVVFGESASQALEFARSGNAEVAFVALSQVRAGLANGLSSHPVDRCLHGGLNQVIVGVASTAHPELVRELVDFVGSDPTRSAIEAYGYGAAHSQQGRSACRGGG